MFSQVFETAGLQQQGPVGVALQQGYVVGGNQGGHANPVEIPEYL